MARIRRCWAPAPLRPVVCNGYERQFTYVYGAVSPLQGQLDWALSEKMNTTQMTAFLSQVGQAHPKSSSSWCWTGPVLIRPKSWSCPKHPVDPLPGYSPELNPQEHIWDEVREKAFPNLVLDEMG